MVWKCAGFSPFLCFRKLLGAATEKDRGRSAPREVSSPFRACCLSSATTGRAFRFRRRSCPHRRVTMPRFVFRSHEVPIANVFGGAHRHARSFPFASFNRMQASLLPSLLHSRASIVVSAPTGAGKTVIFSLAFVAMIKQLREKLSSGGRFQSGASKAVYIAPLKSIVEERMADWRRRYSPLGLKVVELTGDSASEFTGRDFMRMIDQADLLIATPEKLESVSRRSTPRQRACFLHLTPLIDEIHMSTTHGELHLKHACHGSRDSQGTPSVRACPSPRSALSLYLRHYQTAGMLPPGCRHRNKRQYHEFGQEYRPCPLALHVQGVQFQQK